MTSRELVFPLLSHALRNGHNLKGEALEGVKKKEMMQRSCTASFKSFPCLLL